MTTPMEFASLTSVSDRIRLGALTSAQLTQAMLDRIAALDPIYRSFTTVLADRAIMRAEQADAEIARGQWRGPLHGVPIAVKDLCNTVFAPTGAGTKLFRDWIPGHNATVVDRLEQAGAVILGKLSMTEGAYTSHHPDNPGPLNPWGRDHWVGSSSTGSGVATAAGLCYGALGSDTGGSIRFPSATCGLTGIKPTWGRVSRYGVFPLAASLDHVGPMARSAADCAALLGVIAGLDAHDPTTLPDEVPNYLGSIGDSIRGLTIGIDQSFINDEIDPQVVAAVAAAEQVLINLGARIRDIAMPPTTRLIQGWIPFCSVETALAHRETYPKHRDQYGPDLAALIEQGLAVTGPELGAIYHERLAFSGALKTVFEAVDLILVPTMPVPIPSLTRMGEYGKDPTVLERILRFTAPFDFSGSPTITLPSGIDTAGLPLSLQLVGRHNAEDLLCRAGHAFQSVTDWHKRRPPLAN
ncbi:amidase [Acidisoma cellulosilytica]|uniref:Amidase n=1 Tax=Acidisoma cellulosilyticum TaxID=2802395 RepID=A0A963Z1V5_9PROT|nr:amidase [Acidisoma cellulosilyticum]MCB8881179.1 amidase [Acidisoma cellulosilyticum]